jgi:hypothetical protein
MFEARHPTYAMSDKRQRKVTIEVPGAATGDYEALDKVMEDYEEFFISNWRADNYNERTFGDGYDSPDVETYSSWNFLPATEELTPGQKSMLSELHVALKENTDTPEDTYVKTRVRDSDFHRIG